MLTINNYYNNIIIMKLIQKTEMFLKCHKNIFFGGRLMIFHYSTVFTFHIRKCIIIIDVQTFISMYTILLVES